jgi:DNA repair protein RadC
VSEPSRADLNITQRLKDGLSLVDVRVLDHIVVGEDCVSLAQRGLI